MTKTSTRADHSVVGDPLKGKVGGAMAMTGGFVCLLGSNAVDRSQVSTIALIASGATFVVLGALLLLFPTTRWLVRIVLYGSIATLSAYLAIGDPIGAAPMFYMWPMAFSAYFMPRRHLLSVTLLSGVGLVAALLINRHDHAGADTMLGVISSVGIVAVVMDAMNRRERALRDQLEVNAGTDPLTGLLNRRAFDPELDELLGGGADDRPLCLVMFDLDHFKRFNDARGHLVGDEALRRLAAVLRRQAGPEDPIARFGGEEFTVAMPGADVPRALAFTQRVAEALERAGDPDWHLTVSAGIAQALPGDRGLALVARADAALYDAKRAGRNRAAYTTGETGIGHSFHLKS